MLGRLNAKTIEQCEKELLAIGFSSEEIKELNAIIKTMIEATLDQYFNGK